MKIKKTQEKCSHKLLMMGLIVGTIVDSPHVNKQQLKEFGIIKD